MNAEPGIPPGLTDAEARVQDRNRHQLGVINSHINCLGYRHSDVGLKMSLFYEHFDRGSMHD
jgi:hypothetical protein